MGAIEEMEVLLECATVKDAFASLSAADRSVLSLRYLGHALSSKTIAEFCEALQIPHGQLRRWEEKALANLREVWPETAERCELQLQAVRHADEHDVLLKNLQPLTF